MAYYWPHSVVADKHRNNYYADALNKGSRMAQSQKELGAIPKQTGRNQDPKPSGGEAKIREKEILTLEGNKRKVTLEEGWNTVICKVICHENGDEFSIHEPVNPYKLQYATGKLLISSFNRDCPSDMKISVLEPEELNIEIKSKRKQTEVINILQEAVKGILMEEAQFTSRDEFTCVMLNHLDDESFRSLTYSSANLYYFNKNNSFIVQMVGPDYCSLFKNFQGVSQQLSICQKVVQQAVSVDSLRQDIDEKKKNDILQGHSFQRKRSCPSYKLDYLKTFGAFDDLRKAFTCDIKLLKNEILFSCKQKDQLDGLVKEFDVYCSRLMRFPVDFLPVAAWDLLTNVNERKDMFLKQHLRCSNFKFCVENNRRMFICLSQKENDTICQSLKNCYYQTAILSEILDLPMVQQYLKENEDDINVVKDTVHPDVTNIYAMQNVEKRITTMPIPFLPVEAWSFLSNVNERRDQLLKQHLGCSDFKFLLDDRQGFMILCISKADKQTIYQSLQNCFHQSSIHSEILEQPRVQQVLNDNKDAICVCKVIGQPEVTHLYFMQYVSENITEAFGQHGKHCDVFVSEYLKSQGASFLRKLEREHEVKASFSERFIEFTGGFEAGSLVLSKVEGQLETIVHQLDAEKCKQIDRSNAVKVKLKQIADKNGCGLKTVQTKRKDKLSGICKGARYLTTWVLRDMTNCVSVVCGDINSMKLDAIIVPVNSSLFGEGPLKEGILPLSHIFYRYDKSQGKLGEVLDGKFGDEMICKSGFAIVVSDTNVIKGAERKVTLKDKDLQESVKKVIDWFKSMNHQINIGVCVPQDEKDFDIQLYDFVPPFLSANKNALLKQFHLHFFVKSNIEKWIQNANRCLREQCHRRIVYPDVYGIFTAKEDTKVQISDKSLLNIEAECLVVSVGDDFNLSYGIVAKLINEKAGPGLQEELNKAKKSNAEKHIIATRPWRLSNMGVKLLLFAVVPHWRKCERKTQKLQKLVEDCLLLADQYYCKSVAFPVFGIGKLEYPMRDVAVAFFDAIDVYKEDSVFQVISQINISAPVIKDDDTVLKLLKMEDERRFNISQTEDCFNQKAIPCLCAGRGKVAHKVVKKGNESYLLGGEFVHVQLYTSQGSVGDIKGTLRELTVPCGKSKDALIEAIVKVVSYCEDNRITSILVSSDSGFRFCESDQIKIISETVERTVHKFGAKQYPALIYKYLKSVVMNVSDAFTFSAEVLSGGSTSSYYPSFWTKQPDIVWTKISYPVTVYGLNVVIIGESKACGSTLKDVNHMLTLHEENGDDSDYEYVDARENTDVGQGVENEKDRSIKSEQHAEDSGEVEEEDNVHCDLIYDEVTAELNPGLVRYLMSVEKNEKWTNFVESQYQVQVEINSSTKSFVRGKLDKIIEFEHYLENDFPESDQFAWNDQHFETVEKSQYQFLVPMLGHEAEKIQQLHFDGIERIVKEVESLQISDNGFLIACPPRYKSEICKKILAWRSQLMSEKVKTNPKLDFVITEACFKYRSMHIAVECTDITDCDVDCIVSSVNSDMHCKDGVAKKIAAKAGQHYKEFCKNGHLKISECKHIKLGDEPKMKCRGVLNVNCFPSNISKGEDLTYLEEMRDSISNCFTVAEENGYSSIALPMLRTGQLRLGVPLCAQECFRAIDDRNFKTLKEIKFVALDHNKVKEFVKVLASVTSSKSDQEAMVSTSLKVKLKSANTQIHIVNDIGTYPEVTARVEFRTDMLQDLKVQKLSLERRIKRSTDGPLLVLQVPEPTWQDSTETYSNEINETVQCILQKAKLWKISTIALPTIENADENLMLDAYSCEAMLEAVCDFCTKNPKAIKLIQIMTSKQELMSTMIQLVLPSLPDQSK